MAIQQCQNKLDSTSNTTYGTYKRANQCPIQLSPIVNTGYISYEYSYCPDKPNISAGSITNTVTTDIVNVYTEKTANKTRVILGDTIVYTINIVNNSTVSINDLFFIDTIPTGTTFIQDSFNVVGYGAIPGVDPNYGVDLTTIVGTLGPDDSCVVTFSIRFNQISCPKQVVNSSNVYYNY